jgi:hypothetical protein
MAATSTILSEFDHFKPQAVQDMVVQEYDAPIGPVSAPKMGQPLEFLIPAEEGLYRDLSNTLIMLKVKLTKEDGTKTAVTDAVAPVNLLFSSLFKSFDVRLNGVTVTHQNALYAYRAYMETLLTFSEAVLKTRGACQGWTKDDAGAFDTLLLTDDATNKIPANTGFVARQKWLANDKTLVLMGRPHADIFNQDLDIPDNVNIRLTFTPNENKFVLLAAANATFRLELTEARLFVRTKQLSENARTAHREMCLENGGYRFPLVKTIMNLHDVKGGIAEVSSLVPSNTLPSRIVLGLVDAAAVAGAYNLNPLQFKNASLTNMKLTVGGQSMPREALQMNFTTGEYLTAYYTTLGALNMDIGNRAISLTPTEWANGYNLYAFKLQPGPIELRDSATGDKDKQGLCTANFNFGTPAAGLSLIVFAEVPGAVHISPAGEVSLV